MTAGLPNLVDDDVKSELKSKNGKYADSEEKRKEKSSSSDRGRG